MLQMICNKVKALEIERGFSWGSKDWLGWRRRFETRIKTTREVSVNITKHKTLFSLPISLLLLIPFDLLSIFDAHFLFTLLKPSSFQKHDSSIRCLLSCFCSFLNFLSLSPPFVCLLYFVTAFLPYITSHFQSWKYQFTKPVFENFKPNSINPREWWQITAWPCGSGNEWL